MSWWTLDSIIKEAAYYEQYYASVPPVACPNDGEPLRIAPPSESGIQLYCVFDGWAYPRDYDPNTMSGM